MIGTSLLTCYGSGWDAGICAKATAFVTKCWTFVIRGNYSSANVVLGPENWCNYYLLNLQTAHRDLITRISFQINCSNILQPAPTDNDNTTKVETFGHRFFFWLKMSFMGSDFIGMDSEITRFCFMKKLDTA